MKNGLRLFVFILVVITGSFGLFGFQIYPENGTTIFEEDFESYVTDYRLEKAFSVWDEGAKLNIHLSKSIIESGDNSLQIDVLGPNPYTGQKSGSIYHSISLFQRNWSNASGISFWINNPSDNSLWLTFNFKEAFNEYWSADHGAVFFLLSDNGIYDQQENLYGNLVIPAGFTGYVLLPITSFSIPGWNTARGDEILQLADIESFAFGVTLEQDYPRTFYIDSFKVIGPDVMPPSILGPDTIQVPDSGELRDVFQVYSPIKEKTPGTGWKVISRINTLVTVNPEGEITVPAGTLSETITLQYKDNDSVTVQKEIRLIADDASLPLTENDTDGDIAIKILSKTEYEKFAADFERWAVLNRPLFVFLSVSLVVLLIYMLSFFQNKLK